MTGLPFQQNGRLIVERIWVSLLRNFIWMNCRNFGVC